MQQARALLDFGGVAFPMRGDGTWSWYAPETANYFPQRDFLASLDFVREGDRGGKNAVRARLGREAGELRAALETGTANGGGYAVRARLPLSGGVH